jgi:hypothetical protein
MRLSPSAPIRAYQDIYCEQLCVHIRVERTATHYHAHCRTLPHTAAHGRARTAAHSCAHCHTLLPHCSILLLHFHTHTAALPHTAAHCCTACRTLPHSVALPDSRALSCALPHTSTKNTAVSHCCRTHYAHTSVRTATHTDARTVRTAALPRTATQILYINSYLY